MNPKEIVILHRARSGTHSRADCRRSFATPQLTLPVNLL